MRDRLSPMVPLSVQLAPQRAAQIMCLWVCDNLRMQCSFNLQIKYPLYSAHSSARGYKVPLAAGCHAERKNLRLGPSGFATPVFTGCAFVCTCIPLRKSCTEFYYLFCRQARRTAYTALCPSRTEILRILFFRYHKCPRITSKYCKKRRGIPTRNRFLCKKSSLIGHKHILSGPFAYKIK